MEKSSLKRKKPEKPNGLKNKQEKKMLKDNNNTNKVGLGQSTHNGKKKTRLNEKKRKEKPEQQQQYKE